MSNAATNETPTDLQTIIVRRAAWILLALIILFVLAIRVRLREVPLERDEGEYAYAGQLILDGVVPYKLAYTMKLPGTAAAYALLMAAFGQTTSGIHTGLLVVNAAAICLVFLIARKLFDVVAGLAAALSYGLMSSSFSVQGLAAHANHFVILFALLGTWVLLRAISSLGTLLFMASGLCFGLAFLMKQQAFCYFLFAVSFLLWTSPNATSAEICRTALRLRVFCTGLILPFGMLCLILLWAGAFRSFVFWTFTYAWQYAAALSLSQGWSNLKYVSPGVAGPILPLIVLSVAGILLTLMTKPVAERKFLLLCFLFSSALAVSLGLYFRPHYFILLLPALAINAGAALSLTQKLVANCHLLLIRCLPFSIFFISIAIVTYQNHAVWFLMSPIEVCREIYGHEPFPESRTIANYLYQHSTSKDRIAVLGSEPQIYFYSRRRSATGYLYTFPLMESHLFAAKMQADMIGEIEQAQPKYVVYVQNPILWLAQTNSPTRIFDWASEYLPKHYCLDGVADPVSRDHVEYRWGQAALDYKPESEYYTLIYKIAD